MDRIPVIYEVEKNELRECLSVIHQSFKTAADTFGLTRENCLLRDGFISLSSLETQMDRGWHMYALYAGKRIIGYMSLSKEGNDVFERCTTLLFCRSIGTRDLESSCSITQKIP